MSMKNSSDTIGNRTRDLPACSAVPQPTVLPRAPLFCTVHSEIRSHPKERTLSVCKKIAEIKSCEG